MIARGLRCSHQAADHRDRRHRCLLRWIELRSPSLVLREGPRPGTHRGDLLRLRTAYFAETLVAKTEGRVGIHALERCRARCAVVEPTPTPPPFYLGPRVEGPRPGAIQAPRKDSRPDPPHLFSRCWRPVKQARPAAGRHLQKRRPTRSPRSCPSPARFVFAGGGLTNQPAAFDRGPLKRQKLSRRPRRRRLLADPPDAQRGQRVTSGG